MRRVFSILVFLIPYLLFSQSEVEWNERIGNSDYCRASSIAIVSEGGYIVAGKTYNSENNSDDIYIARLDIKGHIVWEKMFGASGDEEATSICAATDKGFLIAGMTNSKGAGGKDIWILKISEDGKLIWDRTFGARLDESANRIRQDHNGGYVICGYQMIKASSTINAYVLIISPEGNLIWEDSFGDYFRNYALDIAVSTDGYFITGYFHPMSNDKYKSDMGWVSRYDSTGKQLWYKIYGGEKEDHLKSISLSKNGDIYVAGHTYSTGAGSYDFWLVKLDNKGDTLWQRTYGEVNRDEGHAVISDDDGCTLIGNFSSRLSNTYDISVLRYKNNGQLLWDKIIEDELNAKPSDMVSTPDGGLVIAGESCTKYNFDGKTVLCKSLVLKLQGTPAKEVQYYVDLKVKAWEKRGEFERTEDYQKRVSEENREKVIEKHRQEAITYYASQAIDIEIATISKYNADSGLFRIKIPGVGEIPVIVSIDEAQDFKNSWLIKSYSFENATFDLKDDHFVLKAVNLIIGGKIYSYKQDQGSGSFVFKGKTDSVSDKSIYRGGGDPLKGLNLTKAKDMVSGKYYALIIGIDNYKGQWHPLNNAVRDAQAIELLLKKRYLFTDFKTLYDEQATREHIINAFYSLVENVKENDNVFIYYSGHGEFNKKLNKGYWVPADAQTSSMSVYISNSDIQTYLNGIKSKHTLLVSDACFSGDIFRGNTISVPFQDSEKYYKEVNNLTSRQAMTSGGIEPVMDGGKEGHSVFAYYLLKALNNNEKTFLDAAQLFNSIKIPVVNNSEQTPNMQPVKNTGDEGGQFLFIRK